jgi:hypothetical protein
MPVTVGATMTPIAEQAVRFIDAGDLPPLDAIQAAEGSAALPPWAHPGLVQVVLAVVPTVNRLDHADTGRARVPGRSAGRRARSDLRIHRG